MRSRLPLLCCLALASCAYKSDYVIPADGRARVVFSDGELRPAMPALTPACKANVDQWIAYYKANPPAPPVRSGQGHFHMNIWIEDAVYIDPLPHHLHSGHAVPASYSGPATHAATPVGGHSATPVHAGSSGHGATSVGGSSGGNSGELYAALAVVALVTMPAVAITLASVPPESGAEASSAIDQVNAYNDAARSQGSACAPAIPGQPQPPPPGGAEAGVQP